MHGRRARRGRHEGHLHDQVGAGLGLIELVGQAAVPGAELPQETGVPTVAAGAATLFQQREVEQHDGQRRGQEGWKPVRHGARIVAYG